MAVLAQMQLETSTCRNDLHCSRAVVWYAYVHTYCIVFELHVCVTEKKKKRKKKKIEIFMFGFLGLAKG